MFFNDVCGLLTAHVNFILLNLQRKIVEEMHKMEKLHTFKRGEAFLKISLTFFLVFAFPVCALSQVKEIYETLTNDFVSKNEKAQNIGVKSLAPTVYRDSLIKYFDRIEEYHPQLNDTLSFKFFYAIFGNDTLSFKERRKEIIRSNGKQQFLEIESEIAPYQRFKTEIDGLTNEEIECLKVRMRQMKTNDILLNNSQTCIFYALNLLLDVEGIDPKPLITRNTTFTNGHQLNAFFNHFLTVINTYPCSFKAIEKAELPDHCVLVFRNANQEFIHAIFYRKDTDEFYSKNGLFPPKISRDIRPFTTRYGRYDTKRKDLSKEGLKQLADTIIVYAIK